MLNEMQVEFMSVPRLRAVPPLLGEISCLVMPFYLSLFDAIEP